MEFINNLFKMFFYLNILNPFFYTDLKITRFEILLYEALHKCISTVAVFMNEIVTFGTDLFMQLTYIFQ